MFIELGSVYVICHEEDLIYLLLVDSRMSTLLYNENCKEVFVHINYLSMVYAVEITGSMGCQHVATTLSLDVVVFITGAL